MYCQSCMLIGLDQTPPALMGDMRKPHLILAAVAVSCALVGWGVGRTWDGRTSEPDEAGPAPKVGAATPGEVRPAGQPGDTRTGDQRLEPADEQLLAEAQSLIRAGDPRSAMGVIGLYHRLCTKDARVKLIEALGGATGAWAPGVLQAIYLSAGTVGPAERTECRRAILTSLARQDRKASLHVLLALLPDEKDPALLETILDAISTVAHEADLASLRDAAARLGPSPAREGLTRTIDRVRTKESAQAAILAIDGIDPASPDAAAQLATWLSSDAPLAVRLRALSRLEKMGDTRAVEALASYVSGAPASVGGSGGGDADKVLRQTAVGSLCRLRSNEARQTVQGFLDRGSDDLRIEVMEQLASVGDAAWIPSLAALQSQDQPLPVRQAAVVARRQIEERAGK